MNYILAVFNSRSQTMMFYNRLKGKKIPCSIINNPKQTGLACGICIKFYARHLNAVRGIINNSSTEFVGFFNYKDTFGIPIVTPF